MGDDGSLYCLSTSMERGICLFVALAGSLISTIFCSGGGLSF